MKTFFKRLYRDKPGFTILALMIIFLISHFKEIPYSESEAMRNGDYTVFLFIVIAALMWYMINYAKVWEKVDLYVTNDMVRREAFSLGSYDDLQTKPEKTLFEKIASWIINIGALAIMLWVGYSFIFV